MLTFQNVSFCYPGDSQTMIKDLSFQANEGEFISIIGESGCGKSTIFRLINGLEKMQKGEILVNGQPVNTIKNYSAFMPQKDLLFPWRTIEDNVCLAMEIQGVKKHIRRQRAADLLEKVGLAAYRDKYPKDLSGGMKQRAAFARTILSGSELLLLDEPFSALDSLTRMSLQEWLLRQWEQLGKTVLFITHDVEEALFLSQKIYIIKQRPITEFETIPVPLPYPRKRQQLLEPEIIKRKEQLIASLRRKVSE